MTVCYTKYTNNGAVVEKMWLMTGVTLWSLLHEKLKYPQTK